MRGVVGIDPGFSGGIALISPGMRSAAPFTMKDDRIDGRWLRAWLFEYSALFDRVVIERVHAMPGQGVSSMFSFGRSLGQVEGVIDSMGLEVEYVTPQAWQKFYGFAKVPPGSPASVKKARNLAAFQAHFPRWDMRKNARSKAPHMGMVDAVLIANWGYSSRGASSSA